VGQPAAHKSTPLLRPAGRESALKNWAVDLLSFSGGWATGDLDRLNRVQESLLQAGIRHPQAPTMFFGCRVLAALLLPIPSLLSAIVRGQVNPTALLLAFILAGVGFFLPSIWLNFRVKARQNRIDKALPDILDLLVICIESGLALQAALNKVAEEVRYTYRDFYDELQIVCAEIRGGIPWDESFDHLGKRTGVQSVKSLVGMLIQTEKLGVSIGQALRHHGEFTRTQRLLRVEEKAAKLPVKILFPLVFCILPVMFLVLLGPTIIHVMERLPMIGKPR
jgi:tight adherence protein C